MTVSTQDKLITILQDRERLRYPLLKAAHALLTAVPSPQTPPKSWTPLGALGRDVAWLAAGMAVAGGSAALLPFSGIAAIPLIPAMLAGQALTIGRLRRLVVGHTHEATHGVAAKWHQARGMDRAKARFICETILDLGSAITLTLNGQDYRRKHGPHHSRHLGTLRDPDGAMLAKWGLWPGRLKSGFYGALLQRLADPRWHLVFLADRLASNFLRGRLYRRLLAAAVLIGLLAPLTVVPFAVWLAMIGLPWTVGYQIAAALQSGTEHPFGFDEPAEDHVAYVKRNWQRYPYRPMPPQGLKGWAALLAWSRWAGAIAGHALARATVLDDGMVHHGHHHNAWPEGVPFFDWWNMPHHYLAWRLAHPEREEHAVWGLLDALKHQKGRMERKL